MAGKKPIFFRPAFSEFNNLDMKKRSALSRLEARLRKQHEAAAVADIALHESLSENRVFEKTLFEFLKRKEAPPRKLLYELTKSRRKYASARVKLLRIRESAKKTDSQIMNLFGW